MPGPTRINGGGGGDRVCVTSTPPPPPSIIPAIGLPLMDPGLTDTHTRSPTCNRAMKPEHSPVRLLPYGVRRCETATHRSICGKESSLRSTFR